MKLSFRWYGQDDPVTLGYIRQIPNMAQHRHRCLRRAGRRGLEPGKASPP